MLNRAFIELTNITVMKNFSNLSQSQAANVKLGDKTYDVQFDDDDNTNSKGWSMPYAYCKDYIESNHGTNNSYFADYKGGTVSIVCNETGEIVYYEEVK